MIPLTEKHKPATLEAKPKWVDTRYDTREKKDARNAALRALKEKGLCRQCMGPSRPGKICCLACAQYIQKYSARWQRTSPKRKPWYRAWQHAKTLETRGRVLAHYGNRCACCRESNTYFLTIDHKNSDGSRDPRARNPKGSRLTGLGWYMKIIKLEFPEDLQLLCWNCNHAKEMYGGGIACPIDHPPAVDAEEAEWNRKLAEKRAAIQAAKKPSSTTWGEQIWQSGQKAKVTA